MAIDKDTVRKVARLARIRVPEEEMDQLTNELGKIVGWIDQLQEVNTDGVEPLTSVVNATQFLRADVVNDGGQQAAVLQNAPESAAGFFVVPKVVE